MAIFREIQNPFVCADGRVAFKHKVVGNCWRQGVGGKVCKADATIGKLRLIAIGDDFEECSRLLQRSYDNSISDE